MAPMASTSSPFFACYLLTPVLAPQRLRCTYVGFTVSPTRRIRQHNGEIGNGAKRTTRHRPWEMVAVVHGFPSKLHALQFEYAWQHPYNSRFTKARLCRLVGKKGVGLPRSLKRKLIELHEILQLQPWSHFPLTISYTSEFAHSVARTSGFYAFPQHMRCETKVLEEFKGVGNRQSATQEDGEDDADATIEIDSTERCCFVCEEDLDTDSVATDSSQLSHHLQCYHEGCGMQCHTLCLADHFLSTLSDSEEEPRGDGIAGSVPGHQQQQALLRPERGTCPDCQGELLWPLFVQQAAARQRDRVANSTATSSSFSRKKKKRRTRDGSAVENGAEPALCTTEFGGDMTRQPSAGTGNGEKPLSDSRNGRYLSTLSEATSPLTNSYTPYSDEKWFENDGDDHFCDYEDEENGLDTFMADVDDCHYRTPSIRSPEAHEFVGEAKRDDRASAAVIDLTLDDE